MNIGPDEVCGARKQESEYGFQQVGANELFKFVWMISEALYDARHTQRALFDNFLVIRTEDIEQYWHHVLDHGEGILGDVPTTIGSCSNCSSLGTRGEEFKIG